MSNNGKEREEAKPGRLLSSDIDTLKAERGVVEQQIAEATTRLEELEGAIDYKKAQSEFAEGYPREEEYWQPDEEALQEVQLALTPGKARVSIENRLKVLRSIPQNKWNYVRLWRLFGNVSAVQAVVSLPKDDLRLVRIKRSYNQHDGLSYDLEIALLSSENLPTTEDELRPKIYVILNAPQWSTEKFNQELESLYESIDSGIERS